MTLIAGISTAEKLEIAFATSELASHVPMGTFRVLLGVIHEERPCVSLLGDYCGVILAREAIANAPALPDAVYRIYNEKGEQVTSES